MFFDVISYNPCFYMTSKIPHILRNCVQRPICFTEITSLNQYVHWHHINNPYGQWHCIHWSINSLTSSLTTHMLSDMTFNCPYVHWHHISQPICSVTWHFIIHMFSDITSDGSYVHWHHISQPICSVTSHLTTHMFCDVAFIDPYVQ